MLIRVVSSIVALPILFFFVLMGGNYLEVGVGIISLIALFEFFNALKKKYKPVIVPTYLLLLVFSISFHFGWFTVLSGAVAVYIALILAMYVFDESRSFADIAVTVLSAIYIIFFLYHVVLLSKLEPSFMIWYIFLASWGADTGAYFIGVKFGKRKLSPIISPNKSVEGAIGGFVTSIVLCVMLSVVFDPSMVPYSIVIGMVGSVISIVGDLVASKIKREMDIKDYGNIMPGHGGVMDRFDSLLLVTPFIYYVIKLVLMVKV